MNTSKPIRLFLLLLLSHLLWPMAVHGAKLEAFDDQPLDEPLALPEWFKVSFLDVREDLAEANQNGRGLIIYFGLKHCPYCKALLENNWGRPDIVNYTRQHFDVIGIDVRGSKQVTDLNGNDINEKEFAIQQRANFTPSLLFFDKRGQLAYRQAGYRQPYQFKAALEYVADEHHRKESFPQYFARAEYAESYGQDSLNDSTIFTASGSGKGDRAKPSIVFFEQPRCHACDVLHGVPLKNKEIISRLKNFTTRQVDITSNQRVTSPRGEALSGKEWAKQLKIDYTPTLIFFDSQGKEIIRIEAVIWFYRLRNVLDYVTSGDYKHYPNFQDWRFRKNR